MAKTATGAPMWMVTFADMMSLLMCFFVLMLSFAELDARKFLQIAGSMNTAFGARVIQDKETPTEELGLETGTKDGKGTSKVKKEIKNVQATIAAIEDSKPQDVKDPEYPELLEELQRSREYLRREIQEGKVDIEGGVNTITLRIQETRAFPSGSSDAVESFLPLIERIGALLRTMRGEISVAGHTDDRPIKTARYRSNWELSTSRAVTIVHRLIEDSGVDPARIEVRGYGESMPLVENNSDENRAINRRVEIVVTQVTSTRPDATEEQSDDSVVPGPSMEGHETTETAPQETKST